MKPSVTPLRYPGGKTWLFGYVKKFLEFHNIGLGRVIEPYAGSASVSVSLLRNNLAEEAWISEKDPLIVAFWKAVLYHNSDLIDSVRSLDISIDTWYSFKKYLTDNSCNNFSTVELAASFLFYNRTNYSGIIKAGPLGGKQQKSQYKLDCRFNRERILTKIRQLGELEGKMHILNEDGIEFMKKMSNSSYVDNLFFYVDPPYFYAGKSLYREYFTEEDHVNLSRTLKLMEFPWLLSYDDADFIKVLYSKSEGMPIYTDYQAGRLRRGVREYLFSNRTIPPVAPKVELDEKIPRSKQTELVG